MESKVADRIIELAMKWQDRKSWIKAYIVAGESREQQRESLERHKSPIEKEHHAAQMRICRQRIEILAETRGRAAFRDVLGRAAINVADDRDVVLSTTQRLLVHTDPFDRSGRLASLASRDGAFQDRSRLIPIDPQNLTSALDGLAMPQDVDGQPLKQHREPSTRLGPRNQHLHHAMLRTIHARNSPPQLRYELASVEMPPCPLLGVIVTPQFSIALRQRHLTRESCSTNTSTHCSATFNSTRPTTHGEANPNTC